MARDLTRFLARAGAGQWANSGDRGRTFSQRSPDNRAGFGAGIVGFSFYCGLLLGRE